MNRRRRGSFVVLGALILAGLWFPATVSGQTAKPVAALGRVAVMGDISAVQQRILATRIESFLSERYDLISQIDYQAAEDAAFESLDLDQCTEEECIRKIQEFLQVERLFFLQVLREGTFTLLSITFYQGDSRRTVDDTCDDCSISQLYSKVEILALRLIGEEAPVAAIPVPEPPAPIERPAQQATVRPEPNDGEFREPVTGMEFLWVPGGSFEMGCGSWNDGECDDDEKPLRTVKLDGFWMGKTEVTQGEWEKVMGKNPSRFKKRDNYPVEKVNWSDTQKFIVMLNNQAGENYRLPSEAEWEYACRAGGKPIKYTWGQQPPICEKGARNGAKFDDSHRCDDTGTEPVGSYSANSLGLFDMSGNVWEWVRDVYDKDAYRKAGRDNPEYDKLGVARVVRGGSWYYQPQFLRCSNRFHYNSSSRFNLVGFRLVRPE